MEKRFEGIIPPIVTPFDEDGTINETQLRSEMKICMDAGANGLSVAGSTGEGPTIRDEEYGTLIGAAKDYVSGEQPIVCGIMRTCTRDAVKAGLAAKEAGADAIMVTPPAYNVLVPNEEGMYEFYRTISREIKLPIIIYNVIPQNTILPGLFKRLLDTTDYVMGIKQSVGGIQALYADIMSADQKGRVYAATDDMIFSCFELGAAGAISAILSLFPNKCQQMWECAQKKEHERGLAIQNSLYHTWQCMGGNQFPIRLKYALHLMGRETGFCRSPITYLPDDEKTRIREALLK
ncbi:dihydrodipicolinate synthase family protein [Diplocloster modestus]|uniref:Dihydrodipicolinate synthase family protein n=1 Tax=Diplocloster modestus TaxID=2850322 RepID=A0ABS6K8E9_9FIRM|nr:dihydrodipicolinate synthase family protein [Diplocloster modestus]MBU9726799.1 dihydrodipicolinate synthase family protein [Diplocloster modestus]